jgi:polar amino acid transport system substrate-binding protein
MYDYTKLKTCSISKTSRVFLFIFSIIILLSGAISCTQSFLNSNAAGDNLLSGEKAFLTKTSDSDIGAPASSEPLVIAVEDDATPWSDKNGNGCANDLVRAAFKAVGQDVKLLVVPYARGKKMVINGEVIACFSMSWSKELEGKVKFSNVPLFVCYTDFFKGTQNKMNIKKVDEFTKGVVIGTVIGYEYPPLINSLKDKGRVIFEESASEELNLKKLSLGRIDYALVTTNELKSVKFLIEKAEVKDKVSVAFRSDSLSSFLGFSVNYPKSLIAMEKFNKGMQIISSDGTLKRIKKNWEQTVLSGPDKPNEKRK